MFKNTAICLSTFMTLVAAPAEDSSPHKVQFVTVEEGVNLEVLDWGGKGRALVFLAGMGNDAHVFDNFAPKFISKNHVYGITRRGFGASSKPTPIVANYSAVRLGDDVLAVAAALHLDHPVLAGHSIAGEELSSVGSRHPEKVAGLIYLDAGYAYAFYDRARGDLWLDMIDLRKRIDQLQTGAVQDRLQMWREMASDAAHIEKAAREIAREMAGMRGPPPSPAPVARAVQFGWQKHTRIPVPILAIFAIHQASDTATRAQADAFEAGLPSAHVVRIENANHYVFRSNEGEVSREMNAFLDKLP